MDCLEKIREAIGCYVNWDRCKGFYIGKTGDFDDRYSTHKSEGYHLMWELAKGTSKQICDWEDKLLGLCKNHPKLINKNECPHVTKLAKFKLPNCPTGMFWNTLCRI